VGRSACQFIKANEETSCDFGAGTGRTIGETVSTRGLRGSRPYVFTKCVIRWDQKGGVTMVFNRDSIRRECDDSLRRLHVNVIDLYQMHWPPADTMAPD
jgi:aryl-alcohol dehydrogenase-like predicted oxidoreductase